MSKTYILEPTELTWDSNEAGYDIETQATLFDTSLLNENVICEVSDGTLLKYAGEHDRYGFVFNIDGVIPDDLQRPFVLFFDDEEGTGLYYFIEGEPATQTATVSIYTETSDDDGKFTPERAGLPDMNVTLNYENPTNNGIALVTKALMWPHIQLLEMGGLSEEVTSQINDILYNPGYAPMERLVRAFVFYLEPDVDPYAADPETYVVDFANDWERLAFAICPGMFEKPAIDGGALPPEPAEQVEPGAGESDMS